MREEAQTSSCCSPGGVSDADVVNSERFSVHSNSSVSALLVPAAGDAEIGSNLVFLRGVEFLITENP